MASMAVFTQKTLLSEYYGKHSSVHLSEQTDMAINKKLQQTVCIACVCVNTVLIEA